MSGYLTIASSPIQGVVGSNGYGSTKVIGPLTIQAVNPIIAVQDVGFASAGNVTISPPQFATACVIIPPSGNTVALTLKGVTGDTGIAIAPNFPTVLPFSTPTGTSPNFLIVAAGAVAGNIEVSFF